MGGWLRGKGEKGVWPQSIIRLDRETCSDERYHGVEGNNGGGVEWKHRIIFLHRWSQIDHCRVFARVYVHRETVDQLERWILSKLPDLATELPGHYDEPLFFYFCRAIILDYDDVLIFLRFQIPLHLSSDLLLPQESLADPRRPSHLPIRVPLRAHEDDGCQAVRNVAHTTPLEYGSHPHHTSSTEPLPMIFWSEFFSEP